MDKYSTKLIAAGATILGIVAVIFAGNVAVWFWRAWLILSERFPFLADMIVIFVQLISVISVAWAIATGIIIVWRKWGWAPSVQADKWIELTKAQRSLPDGVQSVHWHDSSRPQLAERAEEEEEHILTLPDVAPLADLIGQIPKGQLAYGMLTDDKPLMLPLAAGYHILAHGDSRSGKTNLLDGLLVQLHHKARHYDLRLIAGDFKRELAATWARSPLFSAVETDPTAIAEMLEDLVSGRDGVLARYTEYQRLGEKSGRIIRNIGDYLKVTGDRPRLAFVCVDELNAVLEAADRKTNLAGALKVALQTGAGAGLFIMGGMQYISTKSLGRDGSKQFVTRAHFGAWDPVAIRTMFGEKIAEDVRPLLTAQAGRGLIRTAGQSSATPFQALKCDESDIISAIKLLTDDQPTMPRIQQQPATQQQPSKAAATATTDCQQAPDLPEIVKRLRAQGMSKTRIIEILWGVKAGSNERYKVASAEYDAILAEVPQ